MSSRKDNYNSFIDLLATPNLRTSITKALQFIQFKGEAYDTLLLNFPEELECKVVELASEKVSTDEFLEYLERHEIIPEPITSWEYTALPILEALPGLKIKFPYLKIHCYGSRETEASSMDISQAFARLTLRTIITDKVDCNLWRETISHSLRLNAEELDEKSKKIRFKAGKASACFTDMGSSHLKQILGGRETIVRVIYVEKPYHFTPLSILERNVLLDLLNDSELEKLVICHVEYVRNYIYRFRNRDRAHYEWALDKAIWPKLRLKRNEVRLLDNLINDT